MDSINLRVLVKEPRGFIRILQVLFGLLAWSTTAGFSTITTLRIYCPDTNEPFNIEYNIKYPFDLRETKVESPNNCSEDTIIDSEAFPVDFSAISMLYVLISAMSIIYALAAAFYYCKFTAKYETDPLAPVVDLSATVLFAFFWILLTCTWALNVSDLKHYTHPSYFKDHLTICQEEIANCQPSNPGKWSSLTISIVCGFTSVLLWLGSSWFIFKETSFHKNPQPYQAPQTAPMASGSQNMM